MVLKITPISTVAYRVKFDESALNDVGIRDKNFHPSGATIRGLLLHTHTHKHTQRERQSFSMDELSYLVQGLAPQSTTNVRNYYKIQY